MSVEERVIRVGSLSLATRAWLLEDRPSVVLVHGLGTNVETWGLLVPRLRDWCTVIAFDRRGHGHSSDATSHTTTDLANDIEGVIQAYRITRPILIGHSIGAWDCLTYAARGSAQAIVCLDQLIASDDPVWRESLNSPNPAGEHGYTDAEIAKHRTQGALELGDPAWREVYGPMNRRAIVRKPDGLFYYRPGTETIRQIHSGWTSVIANGEPYDDISCRVIAVIAERNTGPIHDSLTRLVLRRRLEMVNAESNHDIHVEQPQLIADFIRSMMP